MAAGTPSRSSGLRRFLPSGGTVGTYALLIGIAAIFLFPFIFMIGTALKTSEEVFRYPPQLFPMQAITAAIDGEDLPVYRIETDEGTREMVPVETGIRSGIFATSDDFTSADTADTIVVPLDCAMMCRPYAEADPCGLWHQ